MKILNVTSRVKVFATQDGQMDEQLNTTDPHIIQIKEYQCNANLSSANQFYKMIKKRKSRAVPTCSLTDFKMLAEETSAGAGLVKGLLKLFWYDNIGLHNLHRKVVLKPKSQEQDVHTECF